MTKKTVNRHPNAKSLIVKDYDGSSAAISGLNRALLDNEDLNDENRFICNSILDSINNNAPLPIDLRPKSTKVQHYIGKVDKFEKQYAKDQKKGTKDTLLKHKKSLLLAKAEDLFLVACNKLSNIEGCQDIVTSLETLVDAIKGISDKHQRKARRDKAKEDHQATKAERVKLELENEEKNDVTEDATKKLANLKDKELALEKKTSAYRLKAFREKNNKNHQTAKTARQDFEKEMNHDDMNDMKKLSKLKAEEKAAFAKTRKGQYQLGNAINGKTREERVEKARETASKLFACTHEELLDQSEPYRRVVTANERALKSGLEGEALGEAIAREIKDALGRP